MNDYRVKYTRAEYREEYLRSEEWRSLRTIVLQSKPLCQCCDKDATDVHHMVYRNIVDIRVTDLLPVCRDCHNLIHQAITDQYISQDTKDLNEIKTKTLGIVNDKTYDELRKWLNSKHTLSDKEIEMVTNLQAFVIKKISGLIGVNIWHDDLPTKKFTGRQIIQIRKIIQTGVYRRVKKLDKSNKKLKLVSSRPFRPKRYV